MPESPQSRQPRATLQPRFTLGMLYILIFFFVYCFALIAPELIEVMRSVPTGPDQERIAQEVAREAVRPRLWLALALAVTTGALGIATGVLPGTRRRS